MSRVDETPFGSGAAGRSGDCRIARDAQITINGADVSHCVTAFKLGPGVFELTLIPDKNLGLPLDLQGVVSVQLLTSRSARTAYLYDFAAVVGEPWLEGEVGQLFRMRLPFEIPAPGHGAPHKLEQEPSNG